MSEEKDEIEENEEEADSLEEEVPNEFLKPKYQHIDKEGELWEEDEKKNWFVKTARRTIRYGKKFRPDSNSVDLEEGGKISWKIKPKGKELGKAILGKDHDLAAETKIQLKYEGHIDDVDFYAVVQGKPYKIARDGLQADDSFKTEVGFTKKF
jgi:hypothetical protein